MPWLLAQDGTIQGAFNGNAFSVPPDHPTYNECLAAGRAGNMEELSRLASLSKSIEEAFLTLKMQIAK